MLKALASIILTVLVNAAYAEDLELSLGKTGNTIDEAYSIGITGEIFGSSAVADGWRYRAGWATLGTPYLNLDASMSDYDEQMANRPGQTYPLHWIKPRRVKEVYATIAPEWSMGGLTYSIELGVAGYHPQLQEDLMAGEAPPAEDNRINYTGIFGVSVAYGKAALSVSYQNITEYRDWLRGTPTSAMITTSLRIRL